MNNAPTQTPSMAQQLNRSLDIGTVFDQPEDQLAVDRASALFSVEADDESRYQKISYRFKPINAYPTANKSYLKRLIRVWEGVLHGVRCIDHSLRSLVGRAKGEDYKGEYLDKAIAKKDKQARTTSAERAAGAKGYDAVTKMPPISSRFFGHSRPLIDAPPVYLAMLPDLDMLDSLDDGGDGSTMRILSMLEDFEIDRAKQRLNVAPAPQAVAPAYEEINDEKSVRTDQAVVGDDGPIEEGAPVKDLGSERFARQLHGHTEKLKELGVKDWHQFSTPDRTMMNAAVLAEAINKGVETLCEGKPLLLHCKSGKGRSATVMVGIRSALVIDKLLKGGCYLSKNDIKAIIKEQASAVKSARSVIGLSTAQTLNLERVLYRQAGLLQEAKTAPRRLDGAGMRT